MHCGGLAGGPVTKNLPCNAERGSIPDRGTKVLLVLQTGQKEKEM